MIFHSTTSLPPTKNSSFEVSEHVIACDLWFGPPSIKKPGYAKVQKTNKICCQLELLFRCGTTCCLRYQRAHFLLVGANLPPRLIHSLLLLIHPLDFIIYKILPVHNIMMTADFLFLPKAAHLSIYLLSKPLLSKLLTPPSADKKNSCTVQLEDCALMTLSHWSFSSQSRNGFF